MLLDRGDGKDRDPARRVRLGKVERWSFRPSSGAGASGFLGSSEMGGEEPTIDALVRFVTDMTCRLRRLAADEAGEYHAAGIAEYERPQHLP